MSKILIVEDNQEISELLKDDLLATGFEVSVCHDGYQGVEFSHRIKPDLIILDLMLPAGGGFFVLEKVTLSEDTNAIPVVVLSASRDQEHKQKAEHFGVRAYVEKPYDSEDLIAKIHSILQ